MAMTTQHHLAPRLKKEYRYTSTPPLGLHVKFTFFYTHTVIMFMKCHVSANDSEGIDFFKRMLLHRYIKIS